jgi:hypothetical protein
MKHRTRKGSIEYRISGDPKFPDGVWGLEDFRMTHHADGSRVLRCYCELSDGDQPLIRDVIQSVDADFVPRNVYAHLTKSDVFFGHSIYQFTDSEAEYHGFTAEKGYITETVPYHRSMRGFGTHALNADAWMAARYDFSQGPGIQTWKDNLLTSIDHRGATGPHFERTTTSSLQYHGTEEVTVKAGTYDCHKFSFVKTSNNHPPYDFWMTSDSDFIFVKGVVGAPFNWTFELLKDEAI